MIDPDFWRSDLIGWIGLALFVILPLVALYQARSFVKKL
jgi:hypothetical protein